MNHWWNPVGAHPTVQNGTNGANPRSRRAQLFGNYGPSNPAMQVRLLVVAGL